MEHEKEKIPVALWTLTAGVLIAVISYWYGQNNGLLPVQASEEAPLVDDFFNLMVTIATALFLIVEGAIVLALILFRQKKGDNSDGEPVTGNIPLEIFWTAIPSILVIGLGVYSVEIYRDMGGFAPATMNHGIAHVQHHKATAMAAPTLIAQTEGSEVTEESLKTNPSMKFGLGASPTEPQVADVTVDVTGIQYAWIFNYPDTNVTSGELHIPIGKTILLNIKANDVIHSLWIPQFRIKQDAIPGQSTQLQFVATKTGTFSVVCAELCGGYHGSMRTQVVVHTPEEYQNWLAENQEVATNQSLKNQVAINELSNHQFLAPYTQQMGITQQVIAQIQQP